MRIALLDTTVPSTMSSMARYRDLLVSSYQRYTPQVDPQVQYLGCNQQQLAKIPRRFHSWYRHWYIHRTAKQAELTNYDVVHLLDGSFGYVVDVISHPAVMVTVHDIIPRLQMDGYFDGAPAVGRPAKWLIRRAMKGVSHAQVICSVSQSTANDLRRYDVGSELTVKVVPNAVEPDCFGQVSSTKAIKERTEQQSPYILHVGNNGFYKNRQLVIEVFERIAASHRVRLVMVGPAPSELVKRACDDSGFSDRIEFIVNPDQETLAELYRGATVFLFPSRYEGFGWPPLEAMSVGCPVVSSDGGSLPEVVGDAGIVVAEGDTIGLAAACKKLLDDLGFAKQLANKGRKHVAKFNCQRLAESMYELAQQTYNTYDARLAHE